VSYMDSHFFGSASSFLAGSGGRRCRQEKKKGMGWTGAELPIMRPPGQALMARV